MTTMNDIFDIPTQVHQGDIAQARARLESYLAGRLPSSEVGRAWATAAMSVLAALPEAQAHDWLARTDSPGPVAAADLGAHLPRC